jgi:hypothetical protein
LFHPNIDIVQLQFLVTRTEDDTRRDQRSVHLSVELFGGFIFLNARNDGGHEGGRPKVGRLQVAFLPACMCKLSSDITAPF